MHTKVLCSITNLSYCLNPPLLPPPPNPSPPGYFLGECRHPFIRGLVIICLVPPPLHYIKLYLLCIWRQNCRSLPRNPWAAGMEPFLSVSASRQILPSSALGSFDFRSSRLATDPVCAQCRNIIESRHFPPGNVVMLRNVRLAVHTGSYCSWWFRRKWLRTMPH